MKGNAPLDTSPDVGQTEGTQDFASSPVDTEGLRQHINGIAKDISQWPAPAKSTIDESDPRGFRAFGEKIRIRPGQKVPPPPVCLSIQQNGQSGIFGTLGNFSVAIGKAKSRKTTAISMIIAAALKPSSSQNRINGSLPENKQTILYFDTEQGDYHMASVVDRICRLCEQQTPEHLLVYPLRGESPGYVRDFIEWQIYNTPNVGLVVIDGIRDTVTDINDSNQASERATDLLRWSKDQQIHIVTVIHVNKGNDSIRGALGTELQNKAETVAVISVDTTDKSISVISPSETRNKAFEPVAFSIDETGLPYLVDDLPEPVAPYARAKKPTVDTMKADDIQAIIQRAFLHDDYLRYAQLRTNVIEASQFVGIDLAKSRSEEFIRRVETIGYITKCRPANQRYDVYQINPKKLTPG